MSDGRLPDNCISVYTATIPKTGALGEVFPPERAQEIASCKSEKAQREKFFVWKLLKYALYDCLRLPIEDVTFTKGESGKWSCDKCEFSLSHSKNGLAVAISRFPVGVDLQTQLLPKRQDFAQKSLNGYEFSRYERLPEKERTAYLTTVWARKESIVKLRAMRAFLPANVDSRSAFTYSAHVTVAGEEYALCVAADQQMQVNLFENIPL